MANSIALHPGSSAAVLVARDSYPCGTPRPNASTLDYSAGQVIANGATIKLGTDANICVNTHRAMDLIVDVTGYIPT